MSFLVIQSQAINHSFLKRLVSQNIYHQGNNVLIAHFTHPLYIIEIILTGQNERHTNYVVTPLFVD